VGEVGRKRERREEGGEEQRSSKSKFGGEEGGKEIKQEEGRRTQRVLGRGREGRLTPDELTDSHVQITTRYLQPNGF